MRLTLESNATPETHTAEIAFNIDKKEKVRIGQIFVTGNTKTRDNVIRRELLIYEGDIFNAKKIEDSLIRLKKLDFFENGRNCSGRYCRKRT